jgi:cyanobactin biosynthesis protein (PatB/AcyB/McaB family)
VIVMDRYRPRQPAPVSRPHLQQPHEAVDVAHGDLLRQVAVRMDLMHSANHNDPGPWSPAPFEARRMQR